MQDSEDEYLTTQYHDKELIEIILSDNKNKEQKGEVIYQRIKQIKFFANFFENHLKDSNPTYLFELCSKITYENLEKGKILFMQNDPSNNKLYVILVGKVFVMKKEDLDTIINIRDRAKSQNRLNIPEHYISTKSSSGLKMKILPSDEHVESPIPIPKSATNLRKRNFSNADSPGMGEHSNSSDKSIKYIVTPLLRNKRMTMGVEEMTKGGNSLKVPGLENNRIKREKSKRENSLVKDMEGGTKFTDKELRKYAPRRTKSHDLGNIKKLLANYDEAISNDLKELLKQKKHKQIEKSSEESFSSSSKEDGDVEIDEFNMQPLTKKNKKQSENMVERRYSHFGSFTSMISNLQEKVNRKSIITGDTSLEDGNYTNSHRQLEKVENISEKSSESSFKGTDNSTSIKNTVKIPNEINMIQAPKDKAQEKKMDNEIKTQVNINSENIAVEPKPKQQLKPTSLNIYNALNLKKITSMMKQPVKTPAKEMVDPEELNEMIATFGKVLRIMEAGEALGEKALFENSKRTATIATGTKCEFLVLEKKDFQQVLDSIKEAFEARRRLIFQIFSQFKEDYSSKILDNMIYSFTTEICYKGDYLCREKVHGEKIFIIEEGEVIIEHSISDKGKKKGVEVKKKLVSICVLGKGSIVGEEILFTNDSKYIYSARIASSSVKVLVALRSLINAKFPIEMKKYLINTFIQKEDMRTHTIEEKLKIDFYQNGSAEEYEKEFFVKADIQVNGILRPGLYESFKNIITRVKSNPPTAMNPIVSPLLDSNKLSNAREEFAQCDRHKFQINQHKNSYKVPKGKSFLKEGITNSPSTSIIKKIATISENFANDLESQLKLKPMRIKRGETVRKSGQNTDNIDIKDLLVCEEKYLERLRTNNESCGIDGESVDHRLDFGDGQNDNFMRRINFMKVLKNINKLSGIQEDGINGGTESYFVSKIEKRIEKYKNRKTKDKKNQGGGFLSNADLSASKVSLPRDSFLPPVTTFRRSCDSLKFSSRLCTGSSFFLFTKSFLRNEEISSQRINTNSSKNSGLEFSESYPSITGSIDLKRKEDSKFMLDSPIIHSDSRRSLKKMTMAQSLNYKADQKKALNRK